MSEDCDELWLTELKRPRVDRANVVFERHIAQRRNNDWYPWRIVWRRRANGKTK